MSANKELLYRIATEKAVIKAFVKSALADGCKISVYDGEAYPLTKSADLGAVMKAIMSTDEDHLFIWKDGKRIGWVFLVYGNDGWDVISDYTVNLEPLMVDAQAVSDKREARARA